MSVRTAYELRVCRRINAYDLVWVQRFDELEAYAAETAWAREVARAKAEIGTRLGFTTGAGNEVSGDVSRIVVELCWSKVGEGWEDFRGVVGAQNGEEGNRFEIETAREVGTKPATGGTA